MIGTVVGSYKITGVLSAGGMGTVYSASHMLIGRIAAVKILHEEFCTNRDIVNRFFNEARATSSIAHPGIVEIFDFGYMENGLAYLVMEFLDGEPLSYRIRRGRMDERRLALLLRSACSALAAAHAKGIVHRDLKPDNIYIVRDPDSPIGERTKLLDFGIAKLTEVGLASSATKTGAVMGTPVYMSPEQCRGTGDVDSRADLYSMGCVLYELITGRPPFVYQGSGELLGAHLYETPSPPSKFGAVSPALENLVMRLLVKDPNSRLQTAAELSAELANLSGIVSEPNLHMMAGFSAAARPIESNTPASSMTPAAQFASYPQISASTGVTSTTLGGSTSQISSAPLRTAGFRWQPLAAVLAAAVAGLIVFLVLNSKHQDAQVATTLPIEPGTHVQLSVPVQVDASPVVIDAALVADAAIDASPDASLDAPEDAPDPIATPSHDKRPTHDKSTTKDSKNTTGVKAVKDSTKPANDVKTVNDDHKTKDDHKAKGDQKTTTKPGNGKPGNDPLLNTDID
jgi:eukaryotic-like serine/threonine-protein kinase